MAKSNRQTFHAQTGTMELPTGDLPDRVSVDLNDKDPNAYKVVEVDDRTEDEKQHGNSDPETWNDVNAEDPKDAGPRAQKRINRLKAEREAQKRLREESDRRAEAALEAARVATAEVNDLRRRLDTGNTALASSMKGEREARVADATRRLEQAHTDGNAAEIAKATGDLSLANAELVQIAAHTPAARTEEPQQRQVQPQPQVAPQLPPNVVEWLGHNDSWFGPNKDKTKTDLALSIHRNLISRGIKDNSPEYTQELDKGLKAVYPDHQPYSGSRSGDGAEGEGRSTPRRTNAVAEGSRETTTQTNPRIVELSSSELAIAKQLNLTPQQYAASKAKYPKQNGAA